MARGKRTNNYVKPTGPKVEINDNGNAVVVNAALAGKRTNFDGEFYSFDEDGKCTMPGAIAKIIVTCKGFSIDGVEPGKATEDRETEESEERKDDESPVNSEESVEE